MGHSRETKEAEAVRRHCACPGEGPDGDGDGEKRHILKKGREMSILCKENCQGFGRDW